MRMSCTNWQSVRGRIGGRSADRVRVLPNLKRHVNKRDHNRDRADYLSDVREIG
jgi:hypothetical protein